MRLALGSDHAGYDHKAQLAEYLRASGHDVVDVGPDNGDDSVDYPDYARLACEAVASEQVDRAILVCGTGIGMAIAANKISNIRAANVTTPAFGVLCREHNDANVLTLSGRFIDYDTNKAIADAFLATEYGGDRHQRRLDKIAELE